MLIIALFPLIFLATWLACQVYETGGAGMIKVTWFDNYWGLLERLVKKLAKNLRKWIEE
jgi:hypothetical protein